MWDVYHKIFVIYTVYLTGRGSLFLQPFILILYNSDEAKKHPLQQTHLFENDKER